MKKRYGSISLFILLPVLLLGIFSVLSNLRGFKNVKDVNAAATQIADDCLVSISQLADIQLTTQTLHELALSHIVATDFNTMLTIVDEIHETQATLAGQLAAYKEYLSEENTEDYKALCDNADKMNYYIADLMAFSAAGDKVKAYACANGEIALYGGEIKTCIGRMTERNNDKAAAARSTLNEVFNFSRSNSIMNTVICFALLVVVFAVVTFLVIRPLSKAKKELGEIMDSIDRREGDLTKRINVRSNGEIAALRDGINLFIEKLQSIFRVISDNSNKMNVVVTEVNESVTTSNKSAMDMSAITEEISSTMAVMSQNVSDVNLNTSDVEKEVNTIAEKTYEIDRYSKQMKEHADQIENSARNNMEQTSEKVNNILRELKQSIEDSKSIEQVASLTKEILTVSRNTNLLAINAAIEASRAGEAGKGFSVVATEVGLLANSTRETANNIQRVNEMVIKAVNNLADNATELITYMTDEILPEFEMFVKSGEQYRENASYIETTMDEFSVKIDKLKSNMTMIAQSMDNIAHSINESSIGVNSTADNTQTLVEDIERISSRMDDNMNIVSIMMRETEVFTKL